MASLTQRLDSVMEQLQRIEAVVTQLARQPAEKEWYTPAEVAEIMGKTAFTVREWCRHRRINAEKRSCGRGLSQEWVISSKELTRIQNHGLLPLAKN